MWPAGRPGIALKQVRRGNQGPGAAKGRIGGCSDPKREGCAHKGLCRRTRLNEINQLMLTSP
jgi:hypothetical protein